MDSIGRRQKVYVIYNADGRSGQLMTWQLDCLMLRGCTVVYNVPVLSYVQLVGFAHQCCGGMLKRASKRV